MKVGFEAMGESQDKMSELFETVLRTMDLALWTMD